MQWRSAATTTGANPSRDAGEDDPFYATGWTISGLVTLGVIVRIHWQALRLWLARVPLVRKPPPPTPFVTRS